MINLTFRIKTDFWGEKTILLIKIKETYKAGIHLKSCAIFFVWEWKG